MNLSEDWPKIRRLFKKSFSSSLHFSYATADAEGNPHVCPIGSLVLDRETPRGVYFEIFATTLSQRAETKPTVCVMAVNSGFRFWLMALLRGRFEEMPGIRLYGTLGARREATAAEIARWQSRVGWLMRLKGARALWGNVRYVREVHFTRAEKLRMGKMTD